MKFNGTKDEFLANQNNKSKMISLIGKELKEACYEVLYASDDADVDIVITAVNEVRSSNVTVVGEDTD